MTTRDSPTTIFTRGPNMTIHTFRELMYEVCPMTEKLFGEGNQ
jgi:hypothetical protein